MKRNDLKLAGGIVLISLIILLVRYVFSLGGAVALVYQDSTLLKTIPLGSDGTYNIVSSTDYFGEGFNSLTVSDGSIYVDSADCPDKLCVSQGKISRDGESILCLPHHIIVRVEGGGGDTVDGIAGR